MIFYNFCFFLGQKRGLHFSIWKLISQMTFIPVWEKKSVNASRAKQKLEKAKGGLFFLKNGRKQTKTELKEVKRTKQKSVVGI